MKNNIRFIALAAVLASCETEVLTTSEDESAAADLCAINTEVSTDNIWKALNPYEDSIYPPRARKTRADEVLAGAVYVFNSDDALCGAKLIKGYPVDNFNVSITHIEGSYTQYYICGMPESAVLVNASVTSTTAIPFPEEVYNMYIGSATFDITQSQRAYDTSITIKHLISQLGLTITGVPETVESIECELPSQATHYSPTGVLTGDTKSVTIPLAKAGSGKWSVTLTNVYPCADAATKMTIKVKVKYSNQEAPVTYTTTTSDVCKRNQQIVLSTSLAAISNTNVIVDDGWEQTVEGRIDLGEGTTE